MIDWPSNPVFIDLETRSRVDLRACGGRVYADDPSTEILVAVVLADGVYRVWIPRTVIPEKHNTKIDPAACWPNSLGPYREGCVELHVADRPPFDDLRDRTWCAHNGFAFDLLVWERRYPGPRAWCDSMLAARAAGLPGGLDRLGQLILGRGKVDESLILKRLCKPNAAGKMPTPGIGDLAAVARYALDDVYLLARLWEHLSEYLTVESDVIAAHDAINRRGVYLDRELAAKLVSLSEQSVKHAEARIAELTGGKLHAGNIRSVQQVCSWLRAQGLRIRDSNGKDTLRKDNVARAIEDPTLMLDDGAEIGAEREIDPSVFDVLRLRSDALRISAAKAKAAIDRCSADGRLRDSFGYHGAHTGRWTGNGVQVHNLPRPKKGIDVAKLLASPLTFADLGDRPNDAIAALVRPCLRATPGKRLAIVDYAAIECRGLAWIAGEETLLAAFRSGGDVYCETASRIFGRKITKQDANERQVGKVTVLGCGYGMSSEKFGLYCSVAGISLQAAGTTAEACVEAFRGAYPRIAGTVSGNYGGKPSRRGGVWKELNDAALTATREQTVERAGRCVFAHDGRRLICTLPSGRELLYQNARIEDRVPGYCFTLNLPPVPKATLVYDGPRGEGSLYGGKIAENVVQAICRDLLADAIVRLEARGIPVVLHVHDEIVCETDDLAAVEGIMKQAPPWADGFPIAVEGHLNERYGK